MPGPSALSAWSFALLLLAAAPSRGAGPSSNPCGYPPSWKTKEMAAEIPPVKGKSRLYVLAWRIVEDDRPLRVESALVLKVDLNDPQGNFLAHLYRHPDDKRPKWHTAMTHVSGEPGSDVYPGLMYTHMTRFDAKPKNDELYAALKLEEASWSFEPEEGFRTVGSGVCEAEWLEVTGERPARFFTDKALEKK